MQARLKCAAAFATFLLLAACDQTEPQIAPADETPAPVGPQSQVAPTGRIITIQMYTRDPDNPGREHVFSPALVSAEVGDTLRFVPTQASHQSSSIATMLPAGVPGWEGEINAEVTYLLTKPGVYGYQCVPHYAAGMVGLVIVSGEGVTDNLSAARLTAHPGRAAPEFSRIFAEAEAQCLLD